jgi:DNA-binding NarL/FixJ family response regulator
MKIMLVEDHPVFREGLRSVLERADEHQVVAEAADCETALRLLEVVSVDVVVTDLRLGGQSGYSLIRQLSVLRPELPVLVMSIMAGRGEVVEAIRAGARGYLTKGASSDEVLLALREVEAGRSYLHSSIAHLLLENVRQIPAGNPEPKICMTPRETELLKLLGAGTSPQQAADRLHLAPSTVKTHLRSLFRKFEVGSRTQLLLKAIRLGLVDVPDD